MLDVLKGQTSYIVLHKQCYVGDDKGGNLLVWLSGSVRDCDSTWSHTTETDSVSLSNADPQMSNTAIETQPESWKLITVSTNSFILF